MKHIREYVDLISNYVPVLEQEEPKIDEIEKNRKINKSFVFNLKIPGYKLYKSKSIDTISKDNIGILYGIKYHLSNGIVVRINSKEKSFKSLHSVDFFNKKHIQPVDSYGNINNLDEEKLIKLIQTILDKGKILNESATEKMMNFANIAGIVGAVLPLIFIGFQITRLLIRNHKEKQVYSNANLKREEDSFKISSADENDFKVFSVLTDIIDTIVIGNRNSLIINGKPGLGKSYLVKKRLLFHGLREQQDYTIIKGSTDLDSFFEMLYDYRNKLIIFDDCDNLMDDISFINIIKAVTDTMPRRVVSLKRKVAGAQQSEVGGQNNIPDRIPSMFEFYGKVVIITNLPASKIDSAIVSRTGLYTVKVDPDQMMKRVEMMVKYVRPDVPMDQKLEVIEYLKKLYAKNPELNFDLRMFIYAIDDRSSGLPNWKEIVKSRIIFSDDL